MKRIVPILLMLVCPYLVQAQELAEPARKASFDLLKTQHMVVEVKLNGKGPFRLIFDTGAPVTLINNKLAKAAGVIPKDFKRPFFAPFGSVGQFTIDHFELGEIKTEKVPTVVMDHPTVELISKVMGPIDGIVGMSFFGRYRMSIDYQAKLMTFVPNQFQPPDIMDKMMKSMLEPRGKPKAVVLRAAGVCGFTVDKAGDDTAPGVVVKTVYADSPAAKAGLKPGDRLLVLDDRWTDSIEDCNIAATYLKAGTNAIAVVERESKRIELTIQVKAGL
jgi:hypothetical protein